MKPNFEAMSIKELKAYIFEHRNDAEAISVIIQKIKASPNTKRYSAGDADRFPEIYAEHQKRREEA
ncbi:MAG: hypothetical protein LH660_14515, partial [Phormidesmis sp. CAN_BIN36]|nr:hypothetical protein [Phormidesmis sp. CAN_BIN36]